MAQDAPAACVPLREVLPYIKNPKDLCCVLKVCKEWHTLANDDLWVWRQLAENRYPGAEQDICAYTSWKALVLDDNRQHVAHAVRLAPQDTRKCHWKHNRPELFYICLVQGWDVLFSPQKSYFRLAFDARGETDLRRATRSTLQISFEVATTTAAMSVDDFTCMMMMYVLSNIESRTLLDCRFFLDDRVLLRNEPTKGLKGRVSCKMVIYAWTPSMEWNRDVQRGHCKGILEWSQPNHFDRLPLAMQEIQVARLSQVLDGTLSHGPGKCTVSLAVDFVYACKPEIDRNMPQDYLPVRLMEYQLDCNDLDSKNLLLHCMRKTSQMNSTQGPFARRDEMEQRYLAMQPADELALWTACLPPDFLRNRPGWYIESKPPTTTPHWTEVPHHVDGFAFLQANNAQAVEWAGGWLAAMQAGMPGLEGGAEDHAWEWALADMPAGEEEEEEEEGGGL